MAHDLLHDVRSGRAVLIGLCRSEGVPTVETVERGERHDPADLRDPIPASSVRRMSYREALRAGLRKLLAEDPRVVLMGQDVGRYGGAYAVSMGLLQEFGPERVRDTPLCELTFVGAGIGAAMGGLRPVVEVRTINFGLLAMDQIVNNAATIRHMSGGQVSVPLVIRMATGAGRQLAAQHSHSLEVWFAHVPGLWALAPATPHDAYTMLLAAMACPDPVLIFEHQRLYNLEGEVDLAAGPASIGEAMVRRPGRDLSLICYGGSVAKALEAANVLAREGLLAEVLDLRSLRPLDSAAIVDSVERTHRAVVVDEGWRTCSLAAEVCAQISERAFYALDAPVERVCSMEVPVPYAKHLEDATLPSVERIVAAARRVLGGRR